MILTAIVILAVLGIAYMWASRGFFSALIHMVCTIAAGAIAFAAWEPVTALLMDSGGDLIDWAHGLGLALPFGVSLIVLRLATNAILPKNVDLDGISNMVGGGVCGLLSGVIAVGIFVISLGYLRLETSIMGYEPITFSNSGSLVRTGGLLLPADKLTTSFYSVMSNSTFRTEESLAKWHPDLQDEGPLLRINFDDGKSRHTHAPNSFEVLSHYSLDSKGLLNDSFEPGKKRSFTYIDGTQATDGGSTIEGYSITFKPGANEKTGRVIVGNGQIRLVAEKQDGGTMAIQPVAVVSEADSAKTQWGRWAFEGQKVFIATVGGRNETPMAFEFVVPKGAKPLALYVKGIRTDVSKLEPFTKFTSTDARDKAARDGLLTLKTKAEAVDPAGAVKKKPTQLGTFLVPGNQMPGGLVFQKDDLQGLNADDTKSLVDGEAKFLRSRLKANQGDPALQVRRISVPDGQVVIQVVVDGRNNEWGFLTDVGAGIDMDKGPKLVDENGVPYTPFGYIYETAQEVWVSLHPDAPVTQVSAMPILTRSKPDQKLTLLFRVGVSQKLKYFAVGNKALLDIDPPFETPSR
jgi:hypothetical protein